MADLAKQLQSRPGCALPDLDALADLTEKIKAKGVEDLVSILRRQPGRPAGL